MKSKNVSMGSRQHAEYLAEKDFRFLKTLSNVCYFKDERLQSSEWTQTHVAASVQRTWFTIIQILYFNDDMC